MQKLKMQECNKMQKPKQMHLRFSSIIIQIIKEIQ